MALVIGPEAPFRRLGDVTEDAFAAALAGTPQEREARAIHRAIPGFTRLYLLHSYVEKRHDTVYKQLPPWAKNALALKARGYPREAGNHNGYATFRSYADSARTLVARFTDPRLPYAADPEMPLLDYVTRYCGVDERDPDTGLKCDPDEYVAVGAGYVNALAREEPEVPTVYDLARNAAADFWGLTPAERDRLLGKCIRGRNGGKPRVIVLHIQQGNTRGSLDWHANKVSASATVYANKDGSLVYGVREADGPWTNGDVRFPTAKGKEIVARYGPDPNAYTLSIENEGFSGDPVPQAMFDAVVWRIKGWQQTYGIPTADVVRHADFNSDPDPDLTRRFCPGDEFYDRVIAALGGAAPPAYSHDYPPGYDAPLCATIWSALAFNVPKFDPTEKGTVSKLWVEEGIMSPIVLHFKDATDGREIFHYASGESIGRMNRDEKFRVLL